MLMKLSIRMLVLVLLSTACEKTNYEGPEDQPVYFEYHYINHAWGYTENGWVIDNESKMWGYDLPEHYRWPDSTGHLSHEDLQYNLDQADTLLLSFKCNEMEKYTKLIGGAAEGNISEPKSRGADMGASILSCYAYESSSDSYRRILLAVMGDWEQFNQSAEAEELVDWLSEFGVAFMAD